MHGCVAVGAVKVASTYSGALAYSACPTPTTILPPPGLGSTVHTPSRTITFIGDLA